jgi:phosphatidate cytidylyltransferase
MTKYKELINRIIFGAAGICILTILLSLAFHPTFSFFVAAGLSAVIGLTVWEYYNISTFKGFAPATTIGVVGSIIYMYFIFLEYHLSLPTLFSLSTLFITLAIASISFFRSHDNSLGNVAITGMGYMYIVLPLSCFLRILYFFPKDMSTYGLWWVIYLIASTKATDTVAFICGRSMGKNKITPLLSPKKTLEGLIGGWIGGFSTGMAMLYMGKHYLSLTLPLLPIIILSVALPLCAQLGDLIESLFKRDASCKDSSVIPGLGGLLDIMDSFIITAPITYITIEALYR